MKVSVDTSRCEGHGVCVGICPEVFALGDDDENVRILVEKPGEDLRSAVEDAVAECPMGALTLEG